MNISDGFGGHCAGFESPGVDDNSSNCGVSWRRSVDHSVCWKNSEIVSASGEQVVCDLMEIVGPLASVGDIWLRI